MHCVQLCDSETRGLVAVVPQPLESEQVLVRDCVPFEQEPHALHEPQLQFSRQETPPKVIGMLPISLALMLSIINTVAEV